MPTLSFIIDASKAAAGARKFHTAAGTIEKDAQRLITKIRKLNTTLGSAPKNSLVEISNRLAKAEAKLAQVQSKSARAAKVLNTSTDQTAKSRERANRAYLTALSTLGGAERATSQLTRFQQRLNTALNAGVISQKRYNALMARGTRTFTTANINAKDLRLNMLSLNRSVGLLATSFGRVGPIGFAALDGITKSIGKAREEIRRFRAASKLLAVKDPNVGLRGAGTLGPQLAAYGGAGVAGGAIARPGVGKFALGALGGPGGIIAVATAAVSGGVFAKLISEQNKLETALDEVSAITGIAGAELEALTQRTISLGSQTTKSSEEIANAFKLVASSSPELTKNADALAEVTKQAILLSEASGDDLAQSVNTVTSALAQFGLGADEASRVVDVLAAGAKVGAVEVPQLGEALARTGAVANAAGISLEELVAAIETAGKSRQPLDIISTSLRNILIRLQAAGEIRFGDTLVGTFKRLAAEALSTEEKMKLFGLRALTTAEFMLQNVDAFEAYIAGVSETGVAAEQVEARLDNLTGASARFGASWDALIKSISNTGPFILVADQIQNVIDKTAAWLALKAAQNQGTVSLFYADTLGIEEIEKRLAAADKEVERIRRRNERNDFTRAFPAAETEDAARRQQQLADARRIVLERERVKQEALLRDALGFEADPQSGRDALAEERLGILRALEAQYDKTLTASERFQEVQDKLFELEKSGTITEQRAIELRALAREAIFKKTSALSDEEKATVKLFEANERAVKLSDEKLAALESENDFTARMVSAIYEGEEAVLALNIARAQELALAERKKAIGTEFISPEEIERVENAAEAQVRLAFSTDKATNALEAQGKQAAKTGKSIAKIFDNLVENIQREFANTFADIYRNGLDGAEDFADRFKDIMSRLAGEITSALTIEPLLGALRGGESGESGISLNLGGLSGLGSYLGRLVGVGGGVAQPSDPDFIGPLQQGQSYTTSAQALGGVLPGLIGALSLGLGAGQIIGSLGFDQTAQNFSAGGAALGAAIGSVVPGFGTVLGAAAGATIGPQISANVNINDALRRGDNPYFGVDRNDARLGGIAIGLGQTFAPGVAIPQTERLGKLLAEQSGIGEDWGVALTAIGTYLSLATGTAPLFQFAIADYLAQAQAPRTYFGFETAQGSNSPLGINVESPFGTLGATAQRGIDARSVLKSIAGLDRSLVDALELTSDQVAAVSERLQRNDQQQGLGERRPEFIQYGLEKIVAQRVRTVVAEVEGEGVGAAFYRSLGGDFSARRVQNKLNALLQERAQFEGLVRTLSGEYIPDIESAFVQLDNALATAGQELGFFTSRLNELEDAAAAGKQKLATDAIDNLELAVLAFTEPLAAQLISDRADAERRLLDARAIEEFSGQTGAVDLAEQLNALIQGSIVDQFNAPLQGVLDAISFGSLGGAGLRERLTDTRGAFADAIGTGDPNQIAALAQELLSLSQAVNASGAAFFADVAAVQSVLGNAIETNNAFAGGASAALQSEQLATAQAGNLILADVRAELEELREANQLLAAALIATSGAEERERAGETVT